MNNPKDFERRAWGWYMSAGMTSDSFATVMAVVLSAPTITIEDWRTFQTTLEKYLKRIWKDSLSHKNPLIELTLAVNRGEPATFFSDYLNNERAADTRKHWEALQNKLLRATAENYT